MALKDRVLDNRLVSTGMAVQKRTKADAADQFAASIGFFGFISLIPLVAIAVAVAGQVLAGQPDRIADVVSAIGSAIPGLADNDNMNAAIQGVVDNSGSIGLVGGIVLLIAGLRVTNSLQTATRFVFNLPLAGANTVKLKSLQLASLIVLGSLALAGVAVTSAAATIASSTLGERFGTGGALVAFLVGALLDVLLFLVAYRMYTTGADRRWRDLLPGAILGGLGWTLLKVFGAAYASSQAANVRDNAGASGTDPGSATIAVVASIIGLLLLFYLAGRLYVYGAELSATLMGLEAGGHVPTDVHEADDADAVDDEPVVDVGPPPERRPDTTGTLADRFRDRGALVDASVTEESSDGTGTELVPWQAPEATGLDDRRTRQITAFAASAVAVVSAGLLGRRG